MEFAVFFDKGAQRAGVEQRREDARAAFARGEDLRAGKTFLKPFFDLFWINKGFLIKFAPQKPLFSRFAPLKPLFFKLASPKPL
jgi:hypothetical protein